MQAQMARRRFTLAMAALVMTAIASGRAQTVDVTGDWTFSVETGMGSGSPAITFKQDGEKLTGTYSGQLGDTTFTGTVKGTAIEFSFTTEAQGQSIFGRNHLHGHHERLIAHELAHVAQQQARPQPLIQRQPASQPPQPRMDYVFIMGQDRAGTGNPFYRLATAYYLSLIHI